MSDKLSVRMKLVPRKSKPDAEYHEIVEMRDTLGFPLALVHIDAFWNSGNDRFYHRLYHDGRPCEIEITIIIEESYRGY
jgi:hypothetical protein